MRDKNFIDNLNWEDKAKKNPLFAIMSDSVFENKTGKQFTEEDLKIFYKKGEYLWDKWISSTYARLKREKSDDITVAEYGCGMGRLLYQADKRVSKSIGVDISDTQIELAKEFMPEQKNVSFVKVVPGEPINIDNQAVDLFYSFAVLQHIKSRKNLFFALDEMVRTLRPGGYLCLQTRFLNYQGSNGKFIPVVDKLWSSGLDIRLTRLYIDKIIWFSNDKYSNPSETSC